MEISVLLISISVLTIINIFFVQCRYSLSKINNNDLQEIESKSNLALNRCKKIKAKEKEFLSVCQFSIIVCIMSIGLILYKICQFILIEYKITNYTLEDIVFILILLGASVLEAIIGFYIPRGLSIKNPKKILLRNSIFLTIIYAFIRPFSVIIDFISYKICRIFKGDDFDILQENSSKQDSFSVITKDNENYKYGIYKKGFVDNIFSFEEKQIREVLVPRTDMICINLDDDEDYIFNLIREEGYTRYPVCGKDKDDLLGFIHIRDLYNQKLIENKIDLTKILRKITYVSESELTSRVLEKLRKDRVQMAVVVDEYGGTSGIITVEDILEEIVGEIQDEFDENEELDIDKLDDGSYIVQGTATITEINKELGIEIEKNGFDSIGGWMFFMLGMDIKVDQSVNFSGYKFKVLELDKFRVVSVKIDKIDKTNKNDTENSERN